MSYTHLPVTICQSAQGIMPAVCGVAGHTMYKTAELDAQSNGGGDLGRASPLQPPRPLAAAAPPAHPRPRPALGAGMLTSYAR